MVHAMRKNHSILWVWIFLILAGLCLLSAGCSLRRKGPDLNAIVKARIQEEQAKAFLETTRLEKNHVLLAKELIAKQYYDVALAQMLEAEKNQGPGPEVHHLMGVCYQHMQEPEQAEVHFKEALSLDPDYAPAHNGLGVLFARTGKREKARAAFHKAIQLNPARPDFLNNLGFLEMQDMHLKEAENFFTKSLRFDPGYRPVLNNLAVCYGLQGREKEAFSLLKKHYPPAEALNNMGVIYRLRGEEGQAAILFERALKYDPGLASARENLGRQKEAP